MFYKYRRKNTTKKVESGGVRKTDLVKKLDRIFAVYIRLRDVMPNGMFRCISCGRIKRFEEGDCGHFYSRTHMATRFHEDNCSAECRACLTPNARVLMEDMTWKRMGDLKVGDKLFAFEEHTGEKKRHWKTGTVIRAERDLQDVFHIEFEDGTSVDATGNHLWLTRNKLSSRYRWMRTDELWVNGVNVQGKRKTGPHTGHITTSCCKPFLVIENVNNGESGYLAGMIDADGHICQQRIFEKDGSVRYGLRIGVSQGDGEIADYKLLIKYSCNRVTARQDIPKSILHRGGKEYNPNKTVRSYLITGTNVEKIQFLQRVRPLKISKIDINKLGEMRSIYDTKVKSVKYVGKQEIVILETDTHTYIGEGFAMHNCNRMSADHIIGYRDNLAAKIGIGGLDRLRILAKSECHWTDQELEEKIKYYKQEVKRLSLEKGIRVKI